MLRRMTLATAALVFSSATPLIAQQPVRAQQPAARANYESDSASAAAAERAGGDGMKWRSPGMITRTSATQMAPVAQPPVSPLPTAQPPAGSPPASSPQSLAAPVRARAAVARVTPGPGTLPNDAGQEWREYDITPYTARVTSTVKPEQAILDWILRETGYEAWHTQPLAILNIDSRRLSVYHTPQMHAVVQDIVDRFVNSEAESIVFGMRVVTLRSPDWRAKHHQALHAVATQSQGVQAWLMAKENAALLLADMRRRYGFQEHGTPHLMVTNGQSKLIASNQSRNYIRDVILKSDGSWPGFEPVMGQYDEGFKLEFNPLLSIDGGVVDAVVRCDIDQLEKMIPIMLDVPSTAAPRQRQKIEVPQPISTRMQERFRWPADQVLLISLGVGPTPIPDAAGSLTVPLLSGPARSDMLVFIECRGKLGMQPTALQPGQREASMIHNRY